MRRSRFFCPLLETRMPNRVFYAPSPLARARRNSCSPQPVPGAKKVIVISSIFFAIMFGYLFYTFAGPTGQLGNLSFS